jgi:dTDP-4-dehydrorhamnose reductase
MNILLTGASGQLGTELLPLLSRLGQVTAVDKTPVHDHTLQRDLTDLPNVLALLDRLQPGLVVNAAAFTAVDAAENHRQSAFTLNAELPSVLADWCAKNQSFLLHYSTDYVFDGTSTRPYREDDATAPLNIYGQSKLAGEQAILNSACKHVVLRTSWVYSSHGNNFLLTMLRLARERPELTVVNDQMGCPTWAGSLAKASLQVIKAMRERNGATPQAGLYHYCDDTATSWYDFSQLIFDLAMQLGLLSSIPVVKPVQSVDFPQLASRPMYSVLDTSAIRQNFDITAPSLQQSVAACLQECLT